MDGSAAGHVLLSHTAEGTTADPLRERFHMQARPCFSQWSVCKVGFCQGLPVTKMFKDKMAKTMRKHFQDLAFRIWNKMY